MSTSAQKSRPTAAAADAQESSGPLVGKTNSPYVRGIRFGAAEQALADVLGVSVSGGTEARISSAISKTNSALRLVIEAGLMLLSIRSECEHGEFEALLESHGMPSQRASEAMTYARFAASLSPEDRDRVIELPKTKVLELAKADPEDRKSVV